MRRAQVTAVLVVVLVAAVAMFMVMKGTSVTGLTHTTLKIPPRFDVPMPGYEACGLSCFGGRIDVCTGKCGKCALTVEKGYICINPRQSSAFTVVNPPPIVTPSTCLASCKDQHEQCFIDVQANYNACLGPTPSSSIVDECYATVYVPGKRQCVADKVACDKNCKLSW